MDDDSGITLSALARQLGRAKSGLSRLAAAGRIPKLANGKFDPAAVEAALHNIEPRVRAGSSGGERPPPRTGRRKEAHEAVELVRGILEAEGATAGAVLDYTAV